MNPFRSNIGTLNEILFKDKNKSYGAYALRSAYSNTVFRSLGITAAIMLGGVWFLSILLGKEVEVIVPESGDPNQQKVITMTLEPLKSEKPQIEETKSASAALKKNTVMQVVIKNNAVDSTQLAVNTATPVVNNPGSTGTGTSTTTYTGTTATNTTFTTTNSEPTTFPEEFPEFPGLKKFWAENIKYPTEARENNVEGKVAINFVIDEEGKIMSCKIIRKIGFGCDEEVLRVAKLMPNWKPGKIGGKPVKVSFNQVIDFKLK